VARIVTQMPPGAVSGAIRVPGGFQIVTLRARREVGRDEATFLSMRQVFFPFTAALNPDAPTPQQIQQLDRARALAANARSCEQMDAAARASGSDRPADPGPVRQESLNPPALRQLISGLPLREASQPIIAPDGIAVVMVCSRERRNEAEPTPEMARTQIVRERVELQSRQTQRELRRRAQIEQRS
jgi:peptidyl-prolyl cis-trans isomerase SurA